MTIKNRIIKLEGGGRKQTAVFVIRNGKAVGHFEDQKWENLTRPEYENIKAKLDADGVDIIAVFITAVGMDGPDQGPWDMGLSEEEEEAIRRTNTRDAQLS